MTEEDNRALSRFLLWIADAPYFEKILEVLVRHDPMGIWHEKNPCRRSEYALEVNTILPRLGTAASRDEVRDIVGEEFVRWFGAPVGPGSRYQKRFDVIADELWLLCTRPRD